MEISGDQNLELTLKESAFVTDAVIISAVRASQNTPTTFSTVGKEEIERQNLAQDLPYLLSNQPSVVATSDAGTGVGYTGLRIRGSDITRINVTINGIPLNDPVFGYVKKIFWTRCCGIRKIAICIKLIAGPGIRIIDTVIEFRCIMIFSMIFFAWCSWIIGRERGSSEKHDAEYGKSPSEALVIFL